MKNTLKKSLAALLCLSLLLLSPGIGSAAQDSAGTQPRRITVCAKTDTATKGFCWYTDASTGTQVRIYKNGIDISGTLTFSGAVCSEWQGAYMHKITVTGLAGGEAYTYKVGDGSFWSETGTFVTDNGDNTFNFINISDVQASNLNDFQKSADTLKAAFKTAPKAEFVVTCGDFTNNSNNAEWNYYDEAFAALNRSTTMVPVTGNHDDVLHWFNNMFNLDTSESVQTRNGANYSFDYGNAHIAVLNTNDMMSLSNAQLKWLRNDMNGTAKDWKLVFMHKSPYSLGQDIKFPDAQYVKKALTAICDECGVDMVMSGHDHMYLRTKSLVGNKVSQKGTVYVLGGTAGTKRYEIRSYMAGTYLPVADIAALTIQKSGYGNYWNGTDWNSKAQTNIGGCFDSVSISGGTLTLKAYILADQKDAQGGDVITNIDTLTLSKQTGQNVVSFSGNNTTTELNYAAQALPTVANLSSFVFLDWLPRFLLMLPDIIKVFVTEGIF